MARVPKILITGATGGIGSALARRLKAAGTELFLASRGEAKLTELAQELGALYQPTDVTDSSATAALVEAASAHLGGLDGVAHCVGSILLKPAHTTSDSDWAATLQINLSSAFFVLRSACRLLRDGGGSIVLVSSAAARVGLANHEAIAAAKAGITGLTLSAAATYARHKIRVNCVAPGLVRTPLAGRLLENEAASAALHPLGRIGEPDEVASLIEWLLSPSQGWVTGQIIGIDGGLASVRSAR